MSLKFPEKLKPIPKPTGGPWFSLATFLRDLAGAGSLLGEGTLPLQPLPG